MMVRIGILVTLLALGGCAGPAGNDPRARPAPADIFLLDFDAVACVEIIGRNNEIEDVLRERLGLMLGEVFSIVVAIEAETGREIRDRFPDIDSETVPGFPKFTGGEIRLQATVEKGEKSLTFFSTTPYVPQQGNTFFPAVSSAIVDALRSAKTVCSESRDFDATRFRDLHKSLRKKVKDALEAEGSVGI